VHQVADVDFPSKYGHFRLLAYENTLNNRCDLAVVKGDVRGKQNVLVRVHSECLTGDALGSMRCDCGDQLTAALKQIEAAGEGGVLYVRQEGRGIGLINKIRAYRLQDQGLDTVEANLALGLPVDARDFGLAQQIFAHLGIRSVRLLTNNPDKVETLRSAGIEVAERVPLHVGENAENEHYLHTKAEKLGHMF